MVAMDNRRVELLATDLSVFGGIQQYGSAVYAGLVSATMDVRVTRTSDYQNRLAKLVAVAQFIWRCRRATVVWILHPSHGLIGVIARTVCNANLVVSTYGFETWGRKSWAMRVGLRHADVVTVISRFSAQMSGIDVLHSSYLLRPTYSPEILSDKYERHEDPAVVLFLGRLAERYKGADVVLAVARELANDERWRFVLAGDGRLPSDLAQDAAELKNVRVVERPSPAEVTSFFQAATLLLLPSRVEVDSKNRWRGGEGFGIVLLEAALHGVPVVASDEGACPETVALLGHGVVAPPTVEEFAAATRSLLDNPDKRQLLGQAGRSSARNLAPEHFAVQIKELLEALPHR